MSASDNGFLPLCVMPYNPIVRPTQSSSAKNGGLVAKGRIMGYSSDGKTTKVNGPGPNIDGARLLRYDSIRRVVTVRVDHSTIPEFWLEIELPLDMIEKWAARQKENEEEMDCGEEEGETEQGVCAGADL